MHKFQKVIIEFLMKPRPFFCLYYFFIIVSSFTIGIILSSNFDTKYITVAMGIFTAIIALSGVIYSKLEDRRLFHIKKVEEFSENLFEWIQLMDNLFIELFELKSKGNNQVIDMFSGENIGVRKNMTDILKYTGKYLTYVSLYRDILSNDLLIERLKKNQKRAIKHVSCFLQSTDPEYIEKSKRIMNKALSKMKRDAKELANNI